MEVVFGASCSCERISNTSISEEMTKGGALSRFTASLLQTEKNFDQTLLSFEGCFIEYVSGIRGERKKVDSRTKRLLGRNTK